MAFLYHLCSRDMRGTTLYPLYGLREVYPDIYERERPKFDGRESVLDYVVTHLGVRWGETVNLSALDPRQLVAARRRLDVPFSRLLERCLVRIPLSRIEGLAAVRYDSATHWINSSPGENVPDEPPAEEFSPFDAAGHEEVGEVPALHLEYLERQKARGELALGFVFVPHVLVAGPIDISGLELLEL